MTNKTNPKTRSHGSKLSSLERTSLKRTIKSLLTSVLILICFSASLLSQEAPSETSDNETSISVAQVEAKIAAISTEKDLDEAGVASANELLQQAKQSLEKAEKFKAQAAEYQAGVKSADEDLVAVKRAIEKEDAEVEQESAKTLAEAKSNLTTAESELAKSREQLAATNGEAALRQGRLLELPDQISKAEKKIEDVTSRLKLIDAVAEKPFLAEAQELQLKARLASLRNEILSSQQERLFYVATTELLPLQNELLQKDIERLQNSVRTAKEVVETKRETEIDILLKQANSELDGTPEPLKMAAQKNVDLVNEYVAASTRLAEAATSAETTKQVLEEIEADYKTSRERVDAVGLNETLGLMFRRSKSNLAYQRRDFIPDGSLQTEIKALQITMFRLKDLSKLAVETDSSIEKLMIENDVPVESRAQLESAASKILQKRKDILAPLIQTKTELFNRLIALDTDRRTVVQQIDEFTDYVNEHVLWIRSGATVGSGDVSAFKDAIAWVVKPSNLSSTLDAIITGTRRKFVLFLFLSIAILSLVFSQHRLRSSVEAAGIEAKAGLCRTFTPTAIALLGTLAIAALWPLIMLSIGWLTYNVSADSYAQAMSRSLISLAFTIYPFEVIRQMCRNNGLGESHFGWAEGSRKFLRLNLRWLIPALIVLLFFINLLQYQPSEEFRSSLGRGIMVIMLLVPFIYIYRVLHPNSQFYRGMDVSDRGEYWYKFRVVRFIFLNVIVAALMVFTLCGYYYTTYQIGSRLLQTFALAVGVILAFGTTTRWLLMRRRKMKLEKMIEKREETQRQQIADGASVENVKVEITDLGLDANDVNKQARELFLVAIGIIAFLIGWNIWADVIPAVGILDRVKLWAVTVKGVDEFVTLQSLLYFTVAVTFTVLAVKNLPGILELLLLQRLPLDSGARYAVATILRYIISVVGMIVAFGFLKVQWAQFSWLVAAISVGLGFGLQEIVANFVSGLILLLERPVRIGDIVTIEGTTGVVSKIQMRATTVTNWDQQELVVPNKNLITNSIFNWTLSNVLTRITIEVGVAYGSDPEHVQSIIRKVVDANPVVLQDPSPSVIFQTFGDSSLNFVIRCCVEGPDKRLSTIHDLQVAITKKLDEHNIEIPFPQRVMHSAETK